jgi:anti-sigma regulatory factor (Ser/Thr protein kinase)
MSECATQTLIIKNRLSELADVERWLAHLMEAWAVPPKTAFAVDLVINEAVTNVISYAYDDESPHAISIALSDAADTVTVEIEDDGAPFNPLAADAMVVGTDLEHAAVGGRGIHLMKTFSDAQDYRYISGRNTLTLVLNKQR